MEDCFVPDDHLLGERGDGFIQALQILDGGRISIAALGLGTAIGAYDTALAFNNVRTLEQHAEGSLLLHRLGAQVIGLLGGLGNHGRRSVV